MEGGCLKKMIYASGAFFLVSLLICGCYYVSFRNALLQYNRDAVEQNTELLTRLLEYSDDSRQLLEQMLAEEPQEGAREVSRTDEVQLKPDTRYYLETCFVSDGTGTKEQLPIPGFLIGLSREELTTYLKGYMEYLPINEYLAGLVSYEILSFSDEEVTLRKTYDEDRVEYRFFLCEKNERITVYYSDRKTVYEYTEIEISTLPQEVQRKLQQGFYVKDAKELYSILEGYTS